MNLCSQLKLFSVAFLFFHILILLIQLISPVQTTITTKLTTERAVTEIKYLSLFSSPIAQSIRTQNIRNKFSERINEEKNKYEPKETVTGYYNEESKQFEDFFGPFFSEKELKKNRIVSAHVTVTNDKKVLFEKGYGLVKDGKDQDGPTFIPDGNSIYSLGQLTTLFNAISISQVLESNNISLTDVVNDIFEKYDQIDHASISHDVVGNYDCWSRIPVFSNFTIVRLHHLLTHTSGFDHSISVSLNDLEDLDGSNLHSLSEYITSTFIPSLIRPSGLISYYSHSDIVLLSYLVQIISKEKNYEHFVKKNILEPLQMNQTTFDFSKSIEQNRNNYVEPYVILSNDEQIIFHRLSNYGQMKEPKGCCNGYSTPNDLSRLMIEVLKSRHLSVPSRIFQYPNITVDKMFRPLFSYRNISFQSVASLWKCKQYFNTTFVELQGDESPYHSVLRFYPDQNTSILMFLLFEGDKGLTRPEYSKRPRDAKMHMSTILSAFTELISQNKTMKNQEKYMYSSSCSQDMRRSFLHGRCFQEESLDSFVLRHQKPQLLQRLLKLIGHYVTVQYPHISWKKIQKIEKTYVIIEKAFIERDDEIYYYLAAKFPREGYSFILVEAEDEYVRHQSNRTYIFRSAYRRPNGTVLYEVGNHEIFQFVWDKEEDEQDLTSKARYFVVNADFAYERGAFAILNYLGFIVLFFIMFILSILLGFFHIFHIFTERKNSIRKNESKLKNQQVMMKNNSRGESQLGRRRKTTLRFQDLNEKSFKFRSGSTTIIQSEELDDLNLSSRYDENKTQESRSGRHEKPSSSSKWTQDQSRRKEKTFRKKKETNDTDLSPNLFSLFLLFIQEQCTMLIKICASASSVVILCAMSIMIVSIANLIHLTGMTMCWTRIIRNDYDMFVNDYIIGFVRLLNYLAIVTCALDLIAVICLLILTTTLRFRFNCIGFSFIILQFLALTCSLLYIPFAMYFNWFVFE